nr:hypothetical protein [Tanacetum cinerariifolium]
MNPARFQSATADSKLKPRSTNHTSRILPMSKSSCVTIPAMPKADHSKSPSTSINVPKEQSLDVSTGILWNVNKENLRRMTSDQNSSDPAPECQTMASNQLSSDPAPECQTMASDQLSSDPAPECQTMASDQNSSDPAPKCQTTALNHDSLSPVIQRHGKVTQADRIVTTSNELDLLFSQMFDEFLNGSSKVVSKSSAVSAADALNQ